MMAIPRSRRGENTWASTESHARPHYRVASEANDCWCVVCLARQGLLDSFTDFQGQAIISQAPYVPSPKSARRH
ncbi:hypothetical protein NSPZN2_30223 [Nitrospira defluvii]|uniref:Uncharacterized protein n=1 Tax=Nitrospira defluvii TaxID=330214 RepID=A0ABM8RGY9_9BACT|nr:hypothetical protein NSPZN2_30223 [Nitrospira defluvii]